MSPHKHCPITYVAHLFDHLLPLFFQQIGHCDPRTFTSEEPAPTLPMPHPIP
jgi:hypothetical protein